MLGFDHGINLAGGPRPDSTYAEIREELRARPNEPYLIAMEKIRRGFDHRLWLNRKGQNMLYHFPAATGYRVNRRTIEGSVYVFVTYHPDLDTD